MGDGWRRFGVRERATLAVAAAVTLWAAGCTGFPGRGEREARLDAEQTAARFRPDGARPPLPALTDQSPLSDFITYALLRNPRVEAAWFEWLAAVETITTARSYPDPMLNFGLEVEKTVMAVTPEFMSAPMQMWEAPAKLSGRAQAAYDDALRKRAMFEEAMLAAALPVKRVYYRLWTLNEEVRLTRDTLTIVDRFERLARQRLEVGKVSEQDVLRARMEKDRLTTMVESLEDVRRPLQAQFAAALGVPPGEPAPPVPARFEVQPADLDEERLLAAALERNPRLRALKSEVRQAEAMYRLARLSVVPDYAWGVGVNVRNWPFVVMPQFGVTLPVWRDKIRAEIAGARADADATRARLTAEELDLAVRFAEVAFQWRDANRNVALYGDKLVPKARQALDAATAAYATGLTDFLDLLDAERSLLDYRVAHVAAVGNRETALAELALMVVGAWPAGVVRPLAELPTPDEEER